MVWDHEPVAHLDSTVVAALLLEHWDVLAVAESDETPRAEYVFESSEVLRLLEGGAGENAVARYLGEAAAGLGASPNRRRDADAASALLAACTDPEYPLRTAAIRASVAR
jgi:hypothetical protein